jgi:bifunctional non-homologous end joining protein LigD
MTTATKTTPDTLPTREHHPAKRSARAAPAIRAAPSRRRPGVPVTPAPVRIPTGRDAVVALGEREVRLTNLDKPFWPELGITKRDLLQYYADVAPVLLPHLADRAMVMKRYPDGAAGEPFFMKRAPSPRPAWIETCAIAHASGNVIDFPMVQDLASLLWIVNLGCIDLNPWYAPCDDVDRPDCLHFDLDPVPEASYESVVETAGLVRLALQGLGMQSIVKTTGSRGLHVYVAIVRGPIQKDVWRFAKRFALEIAALRPDLITAEYRIAKRPPGRVLVDYNQNAWGRTLASAYSPRPRPRATVSAPLTWDELDAGVRIDDFDLFNMPARIARVGDLWAPMLAEAGRFDLAALLGPAPSRGAATARATPD